MTNSGVLRPGWLPLLGGGGKTASKQFLAAWSELPTFSARNTIKRQNFGFSLYEHEKDSGSLFGVSRLSLTL